MSGRMYGSLTARLLLLLALCAPAAIAGAQDDDYDDYDDPEAGDGGSSRFGQRYQSGFGGAAEDDGAAGGDVAPWDDRLPEDERRGGRRGRAAEVEPEPSDDVLDEADDTDIESGGLPPLEEAGDGEGEAVTDAPEDAELPPLEDAAPEPEARLQLIATAGLGVGSRAFQRPTFRGLQKLPDTPFAAALVSLRTRVWPQDTLSMDVLLVYQTSLGMTLREQPLFALPEDIDVRSSRLELSVAPTLRLGEGEGALSVAAAIGVSLRDFWPVQDQYQTPSYTLAGPMVRFELIVPLAGVAYLRVGPEVQWVAWVDDLLVKDGVVGDGIAVGAQLSLSAGLSERVAITLDYRESRVYASSVGPMFIDVERFVTAGVAGRY